MKKVRIIKKDNKYYPQKYSWLIKHWKYFLFDESYMGDGEYISSVEVFDTKQEARNYLRKEGYKL